MQNLLKILNQFKDYFAFLILFILSLVFLYNSDTNSIGGFRSVIVGFMGWSQETFSWIPNPIVLKNENKALRNLNLFLSNEVTRARVIQLENARLRDLLDFQNNHKKDYLTAEVVGKTYVSLRSYLIISRGTKDSIKVGMSSRTDGGLVGTVTFTSENYSIIEIIRNKHVSISAKNSRNSIQGIVNWSGQDDYFYFKNIPVSYDIKKGDQIVTSDFSNKFPKDIPIGKVVSVKNENGSLFYTIKIKPFVQFYNLEHIFIDKEIPNIEKNNIINDMLKKLEKLEK